MHFSLSLLIVPSSLFLHSVAEVPSVISQETYEQNPLLLEINELI